MQRERRANAGAKMKELLLQALASGSLTMGNDEDIQPPQPEDPQFQIKPKDIDFKPKEMVDIFDSDFESTDEEDDHNNPYFTSQDQVNNSKGKSVIRSTELDDEDIEKRKKKKRLDSLIATRKPKKVSISTDSTKTMREIQREKRRLSKIKTRENLTKFVQPSRQSRRTATVESNILLQEKIEMKKIQSSKLKKRKKFVREIPLTQEQLLEEAKNTEIINLASLDQHRIAEEENKRLRNLKKKKFQLQGIFIKLKANHKGPIVRYFSSSRLYYIEYDDEDDTVIIDGQPVIGGQPANTNILVNIDLTTDNPGVQPFATSDSLIQQPFDTIFQKNIQLSSTEIETPQNIPNIENTDKTTKNYTPNPTKSTLLLNDPGNGDGDKDVILVEPNQPVIPMLSEPSSMNYMSFINYPNNSDPFKQFATPAKLNKVQKICAITGEKAKYRTPITNVPYSTLEALSTIKKVQNGEFIWSPMMGAYIHSSKTLRAPKCIPKGWLECLGVLEKKPLPPPLPFSNTLMRPPPQSLPFSNPLMMRPPPQSLPFSNPLMMRPPPQSQGNGYMHPLTGRGGVMSNFGAEMANFGGGSTYLGVGMSSFGGSRTPMVNNNIGKPTSTVKVSLASNSGVKSIPTVVIPTSTTKKSSVRVVLPATESPPGGVKRGLDWQVGGDLKKVKLTEGGEGEQDESEGIDIGDDEIDLLIQNSKKIF